RETSEGIVASAINSAKNGAAIVEISCETDFVARTDDFRAFAQQLADQAAAEPSVATLDEFTARPFAGGEGTIAEAVKAIVGKLGENMNVRRVEKFDIGAGSGAANYIHPGDKLGVLVEFSGVSDPNGAAFKELARDVAMHIAATGPQAITRDDVDQSVINKEREIYRQQALNEGKPEKIVDRIVEGKIDKFYSEITLTEQAFVKDPDMTVGELLKSKTAEVGDGLAVSRFARYRLGE
ncbi:MAG TPA: translation elongation factor Ts, partial [candidate division Zixibacteria bacterium]|nr:translation elongation factor Ts [candidate division Zixibacteria bacterium]